MKYKTPINEVLFNEEGDFMAYHAAESFAKEHGYSIGSMCSPMPTALFKGDCYVAKWRNLSKKEQDQVDGIITADGIHGSYRSGPVKIILYK